MKTMIDKVTWIKEFESKYGPMHLFKVEYDGRTGYYSSKKKDQTNFVAGSEAEFTETTQTGNNGEYIKVKPVFNKGQSNFGRNLKREQARYSGFAMAYAKDLVVADKIDIVEIDVFAESMFKKMVELDKSLES